MSEKLPDFNADDPKWTAYVLNELTPAQCAQVERELAQCAEARELVAGIRETVGMLSTALPTTAGPGLTEQQRAAICDTATSAVVIAPRRSKRSSKRLVFAFATAASLFLAVALLMPAIQTARDASPEVVAQNNAYWADYKAAHPENAPASTGQVGDATLDPSAPKGQVFSRIAGPQNPLNPAAPFPAAEEDTEQREVRPLYFNGDKIRQLAAEAQTHHDSYHRQVSMPHPDAAGPEPGVVATEGGLQSTYQDLLSAVGKDTPQRKLLGHSRGTRGSPVESSGPSYQTLVRPDSNVRYVAAALNQELSRLKAENRADGPNSSAIAAIQQEIARLKEVLPDDAGIRDSRSGFNTEGYDQIVENPFLGVRDNPLSTFSIDVDTASYSNVRRFLLTNRQLPPKSAVRIEELINYFSYDYPQPSEGVPFSTTVEVAGCPWNAEHRLVRVGLKGREIERDRRPPSNLVFLLDVSGSMNEPNKLPLVKQSMKLLAEQLQENDKVAIVVYAGNSGMVLPSTPASNRQDILYAIDRLEAGGSTNGAQGIELAYQTAVANFIKGGTNRVILATDGDFNVGVTDRTALIELVQQNAAKGVFLTTLGFGMGNLKDGTLEQLADKGNGTYGYIDDMREAKKLFVEGLAGTLVTIAKDVKIQIEFNPAKVESYRLVGYENRALRAEDFNDDKKDAGEIGAGHTVTAIYELALTGSKEPARAVDPLKYQQPPKVDAKASDELLTLKLRYKEPDGEKSKLIENAVKDDGKSYAKASGDFKFAASVALFGMILRDSEHKGTATLDAALELAREGLGKDPQGYRAEFVQLIHRTKELKP